VNKKRPFVGAKRGISLHGEGIVSLGGVSRAACCSEMSHFGGEGVKKLGKIVKDDWMSQGEGLDCNGCSPGGTGVRWK